MSVKVIFNPYANRWGAQARLPAVAAAFAAVDLPYDLTVTERPGQAIEVARAAVAAGYRAIVAAGGDGTISEVINGLIAAAPDGQTLPFGVIPIGTANDFSDMAGIPRDLAAAAHVIAAGQTRQVDAGRITLPGHGPHYFNNNSAVAMEPMVTLEHIKMTRLSGTARYMVALARGVAKLKAWQMDITWDNGGYKGPSYLLSVCLGPRTGGFYMAPGASMDDGLFDFVFAPQIPKRTVLAVLIRLLRGTHVSHPAVTYGRTTRLTLQSRPGTPIHADGEIIAEATTAVSYEMLAGKLTLLVP